MIKKANKKFKKKDIKTTLKIEDFRNVSEFFYQKFDCVISTGNSLPHVNNNNLKKLFFEMKKLIKTGGYIYFDLRNWDRT